MSTIEPDEQRANSREMWEQAAVGWAKRADRVRDWGMPVSVTMVDALALQPGDTVLELAAGPGDTGFMAAELIQPGGKLISSDGADAMVEIARERAQALGVKNAKFRQLELEWIDMEAATVDAILCRWGIMLIVDPEAAAREMRRVLKPRGRAALAVWDQADRNPWATIPGRVLIELGHAEPPDPNAPGMFTLAGDGALQELLEVAGFADVIVAPVAVERRYDQVSAYVEETIDMSPMFSTAFKELSDADRQQAVALLESRAGEFANVGGTLMLPGSSLVAVATA